MSKMIFTPNLQIMVSEVVKVRLLGTLVNNPKKENRITPRVVINDCEVVESEYAISVIDQLHAAGFYDIEQHKLVRDRMDSFISQDKLVFGIT